MSSTAEERAMMQYAYYGIGGDDENGGAVLTLAEQQEYEQCNKVIGRGLITFVEVGEALIRVREGRLYRAEYATFEEYCRQKWDLSSRHVNRQIAASEVIKNLRPMGLKPESERQARPLTQLEPEDQRAAWQEAVETAPNGKPTAAHVQRVVSELKEGKQLEQTTAMSQDLQVLLSHESTEWGTPPKYTNMARRVMGGIDLDPATSVFFQKNVQAGAIFTRETDGLAHPWHGRVWLNPPYSTTNGQSNQEIWSQKLSEEYQAGRVTEAILLVKSSLGYQWFEALWDKYPVCFARDLIAFLKPDGSSGGKAKLGSAFFYAGPRPERFAEVFGRIGRIK